jgi:hypothetical protein
MVSAVAYLDTGKYPAWICGYLTQLFKSIQILSFFLYFHQVTDFPLWVHTCTTFFLSFLKKSYLGQFLSTQKSEDMKN